VVRLGVTDRRLSELRPGCTVTVTRFAEEDEEQLTKLLALGIVPGDRLRLRATRPAFVFDIGSSSYAVDRELAARIYVSESGR
jgi:Fe2+ transport system protein FeoA